jgi:hypothetical protein
VVLELLTHTKCTLIKIKINCILLLLESKKLVSLLKVCYDPKEERGATLGKNTKDMKWEKKIIRLSAKSPAWCTVLGNFHTSLRYFVNLYVLEN